MGNELGAADGFAEAEGADIVQADAQQQHQHDGAIVRIVGHVAEMGQRRTEQKEAIDAKPDTLDIALRAVERDRGDGDEAAAKRRQRHEESIPVIGGGEVHHKDAGGHDGRDEMLAKEPRRARIFAVAGKPEDRHRRDDPELSQQDRHDHQGRQHAPGAQAQPELTAQRRLQAASD